MRSLFLKIFLSFWAALALFVVLAIAVTLTLRQQPDSPRWEYIRINTAARAAQAYERGGNSELREYFGQIRRSFRVHAFLFNGQQQELSGHPFIPRWAQELLKGAQPKRGSTFGWLAPYRYVAQPTTGPSGQRYLLVAEFPLSPNFFLLGGRDRFPGLGILILIVSSGIVCFFLARYLTAPIVRLREATQRLASGDLTARAGAGVVHGRDEIAQLVRDFDSMAERLENLVNAQSRLLNDISHELRSPLARLTVALGLARQRSGPEAAATLDHIEREADRLNELIGRLLALARLEGGEHAIEKSAVDLGELVDDVAQDAAFEAQGRSCHVRSYIRKNSIIVGNRAVLRSAVENVVRNAMRYTAEGTEVEISLDSVEAANGPEAVLCVSDRGPGVPPSSLDKLFRPFYRLDDARKRQTGGVGLGLAITERAVRLHGGSVKAASRPGGGLVVELRFPFANNAVASDAKGPVQLPLEKV